MANILIKISHFAKSKNSLIPTSIMSGENQRYTILKIYNYTTLIFHLYKFIQTAQSKIAWEKRWDTLESIMAYCEAG